MREKFYLDTVPYEESCEQVGPNFDPVKARNEAKAFIAQLIREFGEPPATARFRILTCQHDFGSYPTVVIDFDMDNEEESNYAFTVENDIPADWDEQSRLELGITE